MVMKTRSFFQGFFLLALRVYNVIEEKWSNEKVHDSFESGKPKANMEHMGLLIQMATFSKAQTTFAIEKLVFIVTMS